MRKARLKRFIFHLSLPSISVCTSIQVTNVNAWVRYQELMQIFRKQILTSIEQYVLITNGFWLSWTIIWQTILTVEVFSLVLIVLDQFHWYPLRRKTKNNIITSNIISNWNIISGHIKKECKWTIVYISFVRIWCRRIDWNGRKSRTVCCKHDYTGMLYYRKGSKCCKWKISNENSTSIFKFQV